MLTNNFKSLILPTILATCLPQVAQAATMSDERVCRYHRIIACNAIGEADPDQSGEEKPAFTLTAIAAGASQYAFEFIEGSGSKEFIRGRNYGFGPTFERGSVAYTVGLLGDDPVALVIRSKDGTPATAESWSGACEVQSVDVDMIEQGANKQ